MELPAFNPLNPNTPAHRRQNSGAGSNPRKPVIYPAPRKGAVGASAGAWAPTTEQVLMSVSENMRRIEESLRITRDDFERYKKSVNLKIEHLEKVVESFEAKQNAPTNAFSLWKGNPRFVLEPRPPGWAQWDAELDQNIILSSCDHSMNDDDSTSTDE